MSDFESAPTSRPYVSEEEMLHKLDRWRQRLLVRPSLKDVLETGDGDLFAAYVLEGFRVATAEAVLDRLERSANQKGLPSAAASGGAAYRVFTGIAEAWSLSEHEQLALLGLVDSKDPLKFDDSSALSGCANLLERLAILLDIFEAINTLLPEDERADAWMRRPNGAAQFEGRSALDVMLEGLAEMRSVRAYLQAEVRG